MAYTHLTKEQRFKIQSWIEVGLSQTDMATRLSKDKGTISREIAKNGYPSGHYHGGHANTLAHQRRMHGRRHTKKLVKNKRLRRSVIGRLKQKDSPEQIHGKRRRLNKPSVCHETIYQYLYTERPDLMHLLRQKKGKYRRRHGTKTRELLREQAKKRWITERPAYINNRSEIGHWEGDTIRGKERTTAIATHVERVSGYGFADKLDHATAAHMKEKTIERFKHLPKNKRKSETNDNGVEFSEHEHTATALGMQIYFALPYHSWERGTNENWNGLLRQFFPKGSEFATVTQMDVDRAVRNLNHRPRKRLNYLSPHEVFIKHLIP